MAFDVLWLQKHPSFTYFTTRSLLLRSVPSLSRKIHPFLLMIILHIVLVWFQFVIWATIPPPKSSTISKCLLLEIALPCVSSWTKPVSLHPLFSLPGTGDRPLNVTSKHLKSLNPYYAPAHATSQAEAIAQNNEGIRIVSLAPGQTLHVECEAILVEPRRVEADR